MVICTGYCLWNSMREREDPADGLSSIDHSETKYKTEKCTNQEQQISVLVQENNKVHVHC